MKKWILLQVFTSIILAGCTAGTIESASATTTEAIIETNAEIPSKTEAPSTEITQSAAAEPALDILQIYIKPTEKGEVAEYLTPDIAFQEKLISLLDHQENRQVLDSSIWDKLEEYGFGFTYNGYQYEIWSKNTIVARPDEFENERFRFESKELCEAVKDYVLQESGITAFLPGDIEGIISAVLVYKDDFSGKEIRSVRIDDKEKLTVIEGWMKRAVIMNGGSGCGFNNCELKLEKADGEILTLAMAGDSCNTYFVNGRYFKYRDVRYNDPFYEMFEHDPIIRAWRTGGEGTVTDRLAMTVADGSVTPESVSLLLYNGTSLNIQYGEDYHLERLADGVWSRQPYVSENWGFHDVAYSMAKRNLAEITVDWTIPYGTLEPGEYRLVKEVQDFRGTGDYDTYELSAEFSILPK